jgi:(4S)-4-hydroxy-5-phosphonooxypentane-2,3-dione isomerase
MIVLAARYRAFEGRVDKVIEALREMKAMVEATEPGCARYDVCRGLEDERSVLLYEQYYTQEAFDAHRQTEHFVRIVEQRVLPLLAHRERELYALLEG